VSASAPRILQSADEAPCGSLCQVIANPDRVVMRIHTDRGWGMGPSVGGGFRDGWVWDDFSALDFPARLIAEGLTEAECRHLSGLSAQEAIAWCAARDKAATASAKRPQPGDVVPWAEVEDGALYFDSERKGAQFFAQHNGRWFWTHNAEDGDIDGLLRFGRGWTGHRKYTHTTSAILVAIDLGSDPEAWRKAMREWTAAGNRPAPKPTAPLAAAVADIEATAEVSESAAWAKVKATLADREDAFVRRGYMLDNLRTSLAAAHKERDAFQRQVRQGLDSAAKALKERNEARAGWAEQTADAARLRIALQEAQWQLVQAHEDIDTLIAKQTATDRELLKAQQDNAHRGRLLARLLDEMARGYFVDRFLDPNLYADAMKAAGREVKP